MDLVEVEVLEEEAEDLEAGVGVVIEVVVEVVLTKVCNDYANIC